MNSSRSIFFAHPGRLLAFFAAFLIGVGLLCHSATAAEPVKISRDDTALDLTSTTEIYRISLRAAAF